MRALIALAATTSVAYAQAPPCITSFRSAERVIITGNAVTFCDDEPPKKQQCFATDLATGKTASARLAYGAPTTEGPTLSIAGKRAKLCTAGKCKTLVPKARVDEGLAMHGVVGGHVVVLINRGEIETFDAQTGKRLAGFSAGKGDCSRVTPLEGDVLLVHNQFCGEDEKGTQWFATTKGKRIAWVGGTKAVYAADFVALGSHVAFVAMTGEEVFVQEAKTGAVAKRIPLGKPDEVWPMLAGNDARLVVVYGGTRAGDLAVIDLATDKVTSHTAKRCH